MYVFVSLTMCMCVCVKRERERQRDRESSVSTVIRTDGHDLIDKSIIHLVWFKVVQTEDLSLIHI